KRRQLSEPSSGAGLNPVAANGLVISPGENRVLQNAAVLLDWPDRCCFVGVARYQNTAKAETLPCDSHCGPQNLRGVAPAPEFRDDDIPDVPAFSLEKFI